HRRTAPLLLAIPDHLEPEPLRYDAGASRPVLRQHQACAWLHREPLVLQELPLHLSEQIGAVSPWPCALMAEAHTARAATSKRGRVVFRFLLRRLGQAIVTIFLVSSIVFLVVYFIPGDPVTVMLGTQGTPQEAATLRHEFGLDDPLYLRYGI